MLKRFGISGKMPFYLAVCLSVLSSGCSTSGRTVALPPKLPPIPQNLQQDCVDPGVSPIANVGDAVNVVGDTRRWAVCSTHKNRDLRKFYGNVQRRYGGTTGG